MNVMWGTKVLALAALCWVLAMLQIYAASEHRLLFAEIAQVRVAIARHETLNTKLWVELQTQTSPFYLEQYRDHHDLRAPQSTRGGVSARPKGSDKGYKAA